MKFLRGLYVYLMYVLGAPLFLIGLIGLSIYHTYVVIKEKWGFEEFKEGFEAILAGLKMGHDVNVDFIKYGIKRYDEETE